MNIIEAAEFISALAALLTVYLAVVELSSRSKAKKADEAMEIYADYLYVKQQLEYIVGSIESFAQKCDKITPEERYTYAKTHIIDKSLFETVHNLEKQCICNFDYSKKNGKVYSKQVLDFSGAIYSLMIYINTLYQAVLDDNEYPVANIRSFQENISKKFNDLSVITEQAGMLLRSNLKKLHNHSNTYIAFLIGLAIVFIVVSIML